MSLLHGFTRSPALSEHPGRARALREHPVPKAVRVWVVKSLVCPQGVGPCGEAAERAPGWGRQNWVRVQRAGVTPPELSFSALSLAALLCLSEMSKWPQIPPTANLTARRAQVPGVTRGSLRAGTVTVGVQESALHGGSSEPRRVSTDPTERPLRPLRGFQSILVGVASASP